MKRTGYIKRKGKRRFRDTEDPEHLEAIRGMTCLIHDLCEGPTEPHHWPTKGRGGRDRGDTTPLCQRHHREFHDTGQATFQKKYRVNLEVEGRRCAGLSLVL